jgi:hypothetical protein
MTTLRGYEVVCWHAARDVTKTFTIPWQDACPDSSGVPQRAIASMVARRRFAESLGEEYSFHAHKVLSVTEQVS